MRRYAVAVALTMACLLLVANRAKAQVQITLGPTASGGVVFTGTSGVVSITLGSCSAGICTLPGFSATLGGSDHYSLVQNGTIILASNGSIAQAHPINFSYSNGIGGTLTGSLQLVNFDQFGSLGSFNDNLVANLTGLGGSLAASFGSSAQNDITIRVNSGGSVLNLFSANGNVFAQVSSGEIFATPEPGAAFMLGVGLLGLGFVMRRRASASAANPA